MAAVAATSSDSAATHAPGTPPPRFVALSPSTMLTSTSSSTSANHADAKQPRHKEKLRVAVVTENFLPKVDGVTRTLARLLEHFNSEGHEAIVFGPDTGLVSLLSSAVKNASF